MISDFLSFPNHNAFYTTLNFYTTLSCMCPSASVLITPTIKCSACYLTSGCQFGTIEIEKDGKRMAKGWQTRDNQSEKDGKRMAKGWQTLDNRNQKDGKKDGKPCNRLPKGWQKDGKKDGKRMAKGWQKDGKRMAKGWQRRNSSARFFFLISNYSDGNRSNPISLLSTSAEKQLNHNIRCIHRVLLRFHWKSLHGV